MTLHVYSLRRPVFSREAVSVRMKTPLGEITVLDDHEPLIASIERGPIHIVDAKGEVVTIDASQGFIEVRPKGDVTILVG